MATEFSKIKDAVEKEKTNKMRSEAKLASLSDEKARILKEANELTGKNFTTVEEVEAYTEELKGEIEGSVKKLGDILKSEGVDY